MQYRRFGRTNIQMPVFSCGGMRYQYKWDDVDEKEIPRENQKNLENTIHRAIELGINHIETARGYGSSERQLGNILPQFPREQLIIQTKIEPTENSDDFLKHFDESLERLQINHVDLLSLHGINNEQVFEWSFKQNGCFEAAKKIQKSGKAKYIGFSTHGDLNLILNILNADKNGFDYINLHWYYIFQKNWPAILEAKKRDMGIFIISPSDKGGMLYKPSKKIVSLCKPLHPIIFNCLYCLARPQIHTLSIGASQPSDFDIQLKTLNVLHQAQDILPPIIAHLEKELEKSVGKDFVDHYEKGIPHWSNAPNQMNIQKILWLYQLVKAYDMVEYGKMRYNLLGSGGHWFPGENAKNFNSQKIKDSIANSPFQNDIPQILNETHHLLYEKPIERLSQQ